MKPFFLPISSICCLLIISSSSLLAQTTNPLLPEQRAVMKKEALKDKAAKSKVFMPNSEYKRIGHTGIELPKTHNATFTIPTAAPNLPNKEAKLLPVAPKYRRSTAELIRLFEGKLDYLKSLPDNSQNRKEITQLEQQLFEAHQRLSHEKECTNKK